jgi:hypothetical protein
MVVAAALPAAVFIVAAMSRRSRTGCRSPATAEHEHGGYRLSQRAGQGAV